MIYIYIYILATNDNLLISQTILIIVLLCLAIVFCYCIIDALKVAIATKKFDHFVEDLTYKSGMLNSTVDDVVKFSNYIDVFESFTKLNVKALVKINARNKDITYLIVDKLKNFTNYDKNE